MEYEPIEIIKNGNCLEFYFKKDVDSDVKRWFYEFSVKNKKDVEKWDEHLGHKMWYTPDIREKTRSLMLEIINP